MQTPLIGRVHTDRLFCRYGAASPLGIARSSVPCDEARQLARVMFMADRVVTSARGSSVFVNEVPVMPGRSGCLLPGQRWLVHLPG